MSKYISEIGSSQVPAQMVEAVEICANCGNWPQAPTWEQCFGCGARHTLRLYVPAKECIETGINAPVGIRWTKWDIYTKQFGPLIVSLLEAWDTFHQYLPDGEYKGLGELRLILSLIKKRVNR